MPPTSTNPPRYCDYYGMLSYADFNNLLATGGLAEFTISTDQDKP